MDIKLGRLLKGRKATGIFATRPPTTRPSRFQVPKAKVDQEPQRLKRKKYEKELDKLSIKLVQMQEWIKHSGYKLVVVFEGRDAAGKGGMIKTIAQYLNPRVCRVVALATPTE